MKSRIVALSLLLSIAITSTFANNEIGVSQKVVNSFKNEFAQAVEVKWENSKEYAKATFKLNDQVMFAYYSEEGQLLAVTRNLIAAQLPMSLQASLKKNNKDTWITDLFEVSAGDETSYYVTLESADYTTTLKSTGAQGWSTFKKDKKNAQ
jgi:hypothetical protein